MEEDYEGHCNIKEGQYCIKSHKEISQYSYGNIMQISIVASS